MAECARGLRLKKVADRAAGRGPRVALGVHQAFAVIEEMLAGNEGDLTERAHQPDQLRAHRVLIPAPRMDGTILNEHDLTGCRERRSARAAARRLADGHHTAPGIAGRTVNNVAGSDLHVICRTSTTTSTGRPSFAMAFVRARGEVARPRTDALRPFM